MLFVLVQELFRARATREFGWISIGGTIYDVAGNGFVSRPVQVCAFIAHTEGFHC